MKRHFRGKANLIIKNSENEIFLERTLLLDGEIVCQINIAEDLNIENLEDEELFHVFVETTEELTGNFEIYSRYFV